MSPYSKIYYPNYVKLEKIIALCLQASELPRLSSTYAYMYVLITKIEKKITISTSIYEVKIISTNPTTNFV